MAVRPKNTQTSQIDNDELPELSLAQLNTLSDDELTEGEALQNVIAELGGESDAKVNVYLIEPGKGNAFVGCFDPETFSVENLQIQYGAGEYLVHVRSQGRIVTRRKLRIAAPKNPLALQQLQTQAPQNNDKLLEVMQTGLQQIAVTFATALQQMTANQPKPKTSIELLQELSMMKQVMGMDKPAVDAFDLFQKGILFAKEQTPREGDIGTGELILEGLKTLSPVLEQAMQRGTAPLPSPPPVPQVPQIQQPAIISNSTELDEMQLQERIFLNLLQRSAAADNDPSTYASMAIDALGMDQALAYASSPQFFDVLCQKSPDAANFPQWYEEFRQLVIILVNDEKSLMEKETLTTEPVTATTAETIDADQSDAVSINKAAPV